MYSLFTDTGEHPLPRYTAPNWINLRYQLRLSLAKVRQYYGRTVYAVRANHLLAKIAIACPTPMSLPTHRYYANVQQLSIDLTGALFLTSSTQFGRVHHGEFYNCPEVIMVDYSDFDYEWVHANWRDACPVRVLYHPYMDLNLALPEKQFYPASPDTAYLSINIAMLMVMYRAFCLEEAEIQEITDGPARNLYQFLAMHVIPSMLVSHLDVAIVNRMLTLRQGWAYPSAGYQHPFYTTNVTDKVDESLERLLLYFEKTSMKGPELLTCVPAVGAKDGWVASRLPDNLDTLQLHWAYLLSRLPYCRLLILAGAKNVRFRTLFGMEYNELTKLLRQLANNHLLPRLFKGAELEAVEKEIAIIQEQLNSP